MTMRTYEAVMKAAADPTRVRILKMLEAGELCVCQIVSVLDLSQATVSKHLFLLKAAGLVRDRKEAKWVHYRLTGKDSSVYACAVLRNLRRWLSDDPVIARDVNRTAQAREMGARTICARGMKLPGRQNQGVTRG
jgi:DNA-binding transcriptional ArsR family regulator